MHGSRDDFDLRMKRDRRSELGPAHRGVGRLLHRSTARSSPVHRVRLSPLRVNHPAVQRAVNATRMPRSGSVTSALSESLPKRAASGMAPSASFAGSFSVVQASWSN